MNPNLKTSLIAIIQFIGILVLIFGGMGLATWLIYLGHEKPLRIGGGGFLVIAGILILIFGDKKLNIKGGIILKAFDPPNYPANLVKLGVGIALMFLGTSLIFNRF